MAEKKEKSAAKITETIFLQFDGREICIDDVRAAIAEIYDAAKQGSDAMQELDIYLKPEDDKAYFVINDDYAGEVDLQFL